VLCLEHSRRRKNWSPVKHAAWTRRLGRPVSFANETRKGSIAGDAWRSTFRIERPVGLAMGSHPHMSRLRLSRCFVRCCCGVSRKRRGRLSGEPCARKCKLFIHLDSHCVRWGIWGSRSKFRSHAPGVQTVSKFASGTRCSAMYFICFSNPAILFVGTIGYVEPDDELRNRWTIINNHAPVVDAAEPNCDWTSNIIVHPTFYVSSFEIIFRTQFTVHTMTALDGASGGR
jgi:hypothetical protein